MRFSHGEINDYYSIYMMTTSPYLFITTIYSYWRMSPWLNKLYNIQLQYFRAKFFYNYTVMLPPYANAYSRSYSNLEPRNHLTDDIPARQALSCQVDTSNGRPLSAGSGIRHLRKRWMDGPTLQRLQSSSCQRMEAHRCRNHGGGANLQFLPA